MTGFHAIVREWPISTTYSSYDNTNNNINNDNDNYINLMLVLLIIVPLWAPGLQDLLQPGPWRCPCFTDSRPKTKITQSESRQEVCRYCSATTLPSSLPFQIHLDFHITMGGYNKVITATISIYINLALPMSYGQHLGYTLPSGWHRFPHFPYCFNICYSCIFHSLLIDKQFFLLLSKFNISILSEKTLREMLRCTAMTKNT